MCSVIILRQPDSPWPLLLAGNRDEMAGRPSLPPGRHWPDRPEVVAGLDEMAGGSWLGLNDHGVLAVVLNRHGTLGPAEGKRSRGELVLEALDHADASVAAEALAGLNPTAYRPFNLIIADNRDGFLVTLTDDRLSVARLADGLTMITAGQPNDLADPRIARHRPLFHAAPMPDPDRDDWQAWQDLLVARSPEPALTFLKPSGFGTVSSSLIALPSMATSGVKPLWRYRETDKPWSRVDLT